MNKIKKDVVITDTGFLSGEVEGDLYTILNSLSNNELEALKASVDYVLALRKGQNPFFEK
jgi:hypothetical protein